MARHRTPEEKRELGEKARAMRAEGRSRREIMAELRIGEDLLQQLLAGTAVPDELRRPRAKDEQRQLAVELRAAGSTYDEIAAELGVSKSTCSLWLRDLPRPDDDPAHRAASQARRIDALRTRMRRERDVRDVERDRRAAEAASRVGPVSSRDLVLAVALSYWREGAKRKPWARNVSVQWMNSDPVLVRLYLEGLAELGVDDEQLDFRLHIHETADEPAARGWWAEALGHPLERFSRSTIKRHNPLTPRRNVEDHYRGCLCVTVRGSGALYDVLHGIVIGLTRNERSYPEWHDGAATPVEAQEDRAVSSALV